MKILNAANRVRDIGGVFETIYNGITSKIVLTFPTGDYTGRRWFVYFDENSISELEATNECVKSFVVDTNRQDIIKLNCRGG